MTGMLLVVLVALAGDLASAPRAQPCGGARDGPPQVWAARDAPGPFAGAGGTPSAMALPSWQAAPAITPSQMIAHHPYLPLIVKLSTGCEPIPGVQYRTLDVNGPPTDRPAEQHADLNLALRGYEVTGAYRGVGDCEGGADDAKAPKLYTLFTDQRTPAFTAVYQIYDWNWGRDCRGNLLTDPHATLAGLRVFPGEVLHLPDSGYDVGGDYEALVLYASEERITLKYTLDDDVVVGYTIHVEGVCVEPSLLALYRTWDEAGRGELPALRGGQPFGRAVAGEIRVAIRDSGSFLDPRSRRDWWQARPLGFSPARRR